ncbi:coproporphyrinogen III oxidase, partial [Caballeronia sp. M23-90]
MTDSTYDVHAVRTYLTGLQKQIADTLGGFDGAEFAVDSWQRGPEERLRGGGSTRILEGGQFFERGGIGFSDVAGDSWQRGPEERLRGGGSTRILEGGQFFERGGIGFSDVAGDS